jgi:predicted ATP-dependent endonuclease of OLD family
MHYEYFRIENYRAIKGPVKLDFKSRSLIPLIGLNECGKTTILQAIFAFDSINDEEYEGRHIKEVGNLYQTKSATPIVSAGIRASKTEWTENAQHFAKSHISKLTETLQKLKSVAATTQTAPAANVTVKPVAEISKLETQIDSSTKWIKDFENLIHEAKGVITISRNLDSRSYSIAGIQSPEGGLVDGFCREIISYMPYILYNDDFQDRPPSTITITSKPGTTSTWQAVFSKLFEEANTGHSLIQTAKVEDQRRRDSIVSDVQAVLNRTLSKAWKSFHLDRNKRVKIRLDLRPFGESEEAYLDVKIVENIGDNERFFDVVDRSKGFLWFYNFVMKTEFNPKNISGRSDTIYLLDEPGSYLHSAAQTKLCEKLRSISQKNGKVIYCTHSPHLLHPESIPINDIHIVSKSSKKEITVDRLPEYKTLNERLLALQPIYEALQINGQQFKNDGRPMLAVEGIYDKYAISTFMPQSENYDIIPGTNANSIVKNIQFLNAFGISYVAIWDNDDEGRKEHKRATTAYGPRESERFMLLPANNVKKFAMEQMFTEDDYSMFRSLLGLEPNSTYESVMAALYYGDSALKKKARENCSSHSREKFLELKSGIESRLAN